MAPHIVAVVGSPRKSGNTEILTNVALDAAKEEGCSVEMILLRGKNLKGCIACAACWKKKDKLCHGPKDDFHDIWEKLMSADGIILTSPVYFGSATAEIKAVMDRAGMVAKANGNILAGKAGGPVVVARRAGALTTYSQIAMFYPINGLILVGSTYWNVGFGLDKGDVNEDEEAFVTSRNFGVNLANLLNKIVE